MPIHDWTRVSAGTFHDFHLAWIAELRKALNSGLLPAGYYALAEQLAGPFGPDVLALETQDGVDVGPSADAQGTTTVAVAPPRVRLIARIEMEEYVLKRRTLVIRHSSNDRIVALVEILSPGNKASRHAMRSFVDKATEALYRGYHLLIVDLFPPGRRDPQGIHGALWSEIADETYVHDPTKPLTLAAYSAGQIKTAYVEPVAVGDALKDMPLFVEPEEYVNVPLEATYQEAYRGMPRRWQVVLEGPSNQ
jgi:hypothetical protein